jgi:myosin heavy subunit
MLFFVLAFLMSSGIAGSGKSRAIESMIAQVTTLASAVPSSQTTTTELTAILNASMIVLTSLTSAATPSNAYTSFHAGLNVTLALDIYGAIASAKISTPYVDASRLTDLPLQSGHRTFGAFYQLLRGATPQEQSYLSLLKPEQYEYLRKSGTWELPSSLNIDDAASADDFREALRACGFKGKNQRGIYQVLAACLLLGNLTFSPLEGITNIDVLEDACTLLDVDPDALGRHVISTGTRDAFVQDVYRLLVEWIVNFINMQLMAGGNSEIGAQISIVEIPSPSGGQNGYGAFARAWIAETLELQLQQESFDDTRGLNAEMIADSVALLKVNADNNSGILLLFRINIRMCRVTRQSRCCL